MKQRLSRLLKSPPSILLMITAAGIVIRILKIDDAELWHDEACTARFARMTVFELFSSLTCSEPHPPVYYLFMKLWTGIFGESEVSLRLPSLISGSTLIPAVYLTASRLFDRLSALLSALFVAFSPIAVYYSSEARNYMFVCLTSLSAFYFAISYLEEARPLRLALFSLLLFVSLFTHNYTLFLAPLFLSLPFLIRSSVKNMTRFFVAALAPLALFALWQALFFSSQSSGLDFLSDYWKRQGFFDSIFLTLKSFFAGVSYPDYLGYLALFKPPQIIEILAISFVALAVFSAFILTAQNKRGILSFVYFLAPVLIPCLISLKYPIYLSGRYEMIAFPGFAILAGGGMRNLAGFLKEAEGKVIPAAVVVFLAFSFTTLKPFLVVKGDFKVREVAVRIAENAGKGDMVVFTDLHRPSFEYEFRRLGSEFRYYSYPLSQEAHPCWMNVRELRADRKMLEEDAAFLVDAAKELSALGREVFVIAAFDENKRQIENIAVNFHLLDKFVKSNFEITGTLNLKGIGYLKLRPKLGQ